MNDTALAQLDALARQTPTAQIAVMHNDEVRLELKLVDTAVDVFAVQKGVLSLMFGMAEDRYLLDLPDCINHHLDPEWTKLSPWDEAKLTIESLLNMETGMDDDLAPLGTIGETWRYNNVAYNYLKKILETHTGYTLQEVTEAWLLAPLGMTETEWQPRSQMLPDGSPITGLLSTASDLLQIGNLVLRGGSGLLPTSYLTTLNEKGCNENPAWHRCWWNNRGDFYRRPMRESNIVQGPIMPGLPDDAIAARGAYENLLLVILVIARTAVASPAETRPARFEAALWDLLSEYLR